MANDGSSIGGADSVTVYAAGSNGNVTPIAAAISGPLTGLNGPQGIVIDPRPHKRKHRHRLKHPRRPPHPRRKRALRRKR